LLNEKVGGERVGLFLGEPTRRFVAMALRM
jgi:hypothetical protein